ncbi:hypothetical protein IAU60_004369 [Kwoniella sp. DSM 27419]
MFAFALALLPLLSSRKFGVSTYQLALVNDAVIAENCDNLEPNQIVCLGIEGQDCTKVYTVVADDNETLWSNNPQIDAACENIYVGEILCALAYTYLPYCDE